MVEGGAAGEMIKSGVGTVSICEIVLLLPHCDVTEEYRGLDTFNSRKGKEDKLGAGK